jgi:hypothetical protein
MPNSPRPTPTEPSDEKNHDATAVLVDPLNGRPARPDDPEGCVARAAVSSTRLLFTDGPQRVLDVAHPDVVAGLDGCRCATHAWPARRRVRRDQRGAGVSDQGVVVAAHQRLAAELASSALTALSLGEPDASDAAVLLLVVAAHRVGASDVGDDCLDRAGGRLPPAGAIGPRAVNQQRGPSRRRKRARQVPEGTS